MSPSEIMASLCDITMYCAFPQYSRISFASFSLFALSSAASTSSSM